MRGYLLSAEVKAGRTDFKEKVLERAKNRKGGPIGVGKLEGIKMNQVFFHIYSWFDDV